MTDLISVLVVGHEGDEIASSLRLRRVRSIEADRFEILAVASDQQVAAALASRHVHVVVSFGDVADYPSLHSMGIEVRRRWIHISGDSVELSEVADRIMACYLGVVDRNRAGRDPLVSVVTAAFRTGQRILRPYQSLLDQTYPNWEWVIMDDSGPENAQTWEVLSDLADQDHRVAAFRSYRHCGVIGEVKRRCFGLARGEILVELDHDDELTQNCLADVVEAFAAFPDAGFAYTDCAEVFESGVNATYGESFAFHFGTYRNEEYRGRIYNVMNYPDINSKTVRHIVSMPNHARAWTREGYAAAGGHSPDVHVADDYELCVRTFLTTRMVHIKRFGYIQHLEDGGDNTQRRRNAEIQRLVRYFSNYYDDRIHERLEELGLDDFIWTEQGRDWSREPRGRPITANYVLS